MFLIEIGVKLADSSQVTVNGLWSQSFSLQGVNIVCDFLGCCLFNGYIQPKDKLSKAVEIILRRMS
jgi:hypothetical protein